jgi:hypothetical protein
VHKRFCKILVSYSAFLTFGKTIFHESRTRRYRNIQPVVNAGGHPIKKEFEGESINVSATVSCGWSDVIQPLSCPPRVKIPQLVREVHSSIRE